jgi:hypothetical protein
MMRTHLLALVLTSALGIANAATFSGGGGQGTSTIGPAVSDDYPSLAAAAADFSGYAGGATGNWTLLINTPSLVEPNNVAFANATNGHNVTIKPAAGITATIEFTTTTVNPGAIAAAWSGNLIIGTPYIGAPLDELTTTSNFTIDGSNNGSTSRDLTIFNTPVTSETQLIRVVGGCSNTTLKNLILTSNCSGNQMNFPIEFTARRTVAGYDHTPSGCHVDNCEITVLTGSNSQNVLFRQVSSGVIMLGTAIDNVTITSNTINGIREGVNLGLVANASVNDNVLSMTILSSGNYAGIQHNLSNGTSGWTINVERNKFVTWISNPTAGFIPQVDMNPGIAPPLTGTYNIRNNFFAGYQHNGGAIATGGSYRAIALRCSVTTSTAVVNIHHNSFHMPNVPGITSPNASASYSAISINTTNVNFGFYGNVDVKNNIFVMEQNNGVVFFRASSLAGPGTLTSDYNTFYLGSAGAKMACYINTGANQTANYFTLADWQTQGFDANSRIVDPRTQVFPGAGKWVSSTDLHFDADASKLFRGTDVGVAMDIDWQPRLEPVIGADEVPISLIGPAEDWLLFQ